MLSKIEFTLAFLLLIFIPANAAVSWTLPASNYTWASGTVTLNASVDAATISGNANATFYYLNGSSWVTIASDNSNALLPASF